MMLLPALRNLGLGAGALLGLGLCVSATHAQDRGVQRTAAPFPGGQAHYYESCGGCHGLQGVSAQNSIPVLRDRVGAFLCTEEGRKYIVQLPNVAWAAVDDRTLADVMNFVVFDLGRDSVPARARRYTPGEVHLLRASPLKNQPLANVRQQVLGRALASCARPD